MTILFCILSLLHAPDTDRTGVVWIDLEATAEIKGLRVTLADVAKLETLDEADKARLMRLEIGRIADIRQSLVFSRDSITRLLVSHGFERDAIRFDGAQACTINIRTTTLDGRRLETMAAKYVNDHLGALADGAEVSPAAAVTSIDVPAARYDLKIVIESDAANAAMIGLVRLKARVEIDGEVFGRYDVPFVVRRQGQVVAAKRRVLAGRRIAAEDLELVERELSRVGADVITDIADAVGLFAPAGLVPGQALTKNDVKQPPIVKKNDLLSARLRSGGLSLETVVSAKQDGAPGERILVENVESKKTFWAVVVDSRTVDVPLP